ncbi:hypothetical protein B0H14DRAFT_2941213 [Mycena olivaceomarginata]|nr:hypothetical protein B0H14DRAFT_2941213 [Mycena olivaceomarginata]
MGSQICFVILFFYAMRTLGAEYIQKTSPASSSFLVSTARGKSSACVREMLRHVSHVESSIATCSCMFCITLTRQPTNQARANLKVTLPFPSAS